MQQARHSQCESDCPYENISLPIGRVHAPTCWQCECDRRRAGTNTPRRPHKTDHSQQQAECEPRKSSSYFLTYKKCPRRVCRSFCSKFRGYTNQCAPVPIIRQVDLSKKQFGLIATHRTWTRPGTSTPRGGQPAPAAPLVCAYRHRRRHDPDPLSYSLYIQMRPFLHRYKFWSLSFCENFPAAGNEPFEWWLRPAAD